MGSMARRRRAKRRATASNTVIIVSVLGIGAAIGGLVYAADRVTDNLDLDLSLDLPGSDAATSFAPTAMAGRSPTWSAPTADLLSAAPVTSEGRVFVRDRQGFVRAFDAVTGAEQWNHHIGGSPLGVDFAPVASDGVVYATGGGGLGSVGATNGTEASVVALDATTAAVQWVAPVTGAGGFPVAVADNDVFVAATELVALDRATGVARWSAPVGNTATSGYSRPAVIGGLVVVGGGDGTVYAFDRSTGALRWATAVTGLTDLGAGPSVTTTDQLVYVTSPDTRLSVISGETGPGQLRALDPATGRILWAQPIRGVSASGTTATATDGTVYVPGSMLAAFDAVTGAPRWTVPTEGSPSFAFHPLAVENGVVYLPGADGALHGLDATSGTQRWSVGAPPPASRLAGAADDVVPLPPAVADGVMYLGSGDHRLYAYPVP